MTEVPFLSNPGAKQDPLKFSPSSRVYESVGLFFIALKGTEITLPLLSLEHEERASMAPV